MEKIEVTWALTIKIWWSYVWRTALFGALLGALLGFVSGIILALMGSADSAAAVGGVLGYLGSIPISIWVMKIILQKQFNGFSITVVKNADAA